MKITKTDEAFLHGLRGRQHWKEADARRALRLYRASGESRAAFARRHGLRASRLSWWEGRLGDSATVRSGAAAIAMRDSGFVELVVGAQAVTASAVATVRVGSVAVELATLDATAVAFVAALCRATGGDACS